MFGIHDCTQRESGAWQSPTGRRRVGHSCVTQIHFCLSNAGKRKGWGWGSKELFCFPLWGIAGVQLSSSIISHVSQWLPVPVSRSLMGTPPHFNIHHGSECSRLELKYKLADRGCWEGVGKAPDENLLEHCSLIIRSWGPHRPPALKSSREGAIWMRRVDGAHEYNHPWGELQLTAC